ncbi:MAG: endonuclease IV [Ruminococcaceae bacterium]|nr:endonuclease IV [Oscillospiraceae bacterium]
MNIKFGPGGNPLAFSEAGFKSSVSMPEYLKSIGLNAYEYQCNKGVKISEKTAKELCDKAVLNDIYLSVHSQYYISLSSVESEKRDKSIEYIMDCMRISEILGAKRIVVHSGSASKMSREEALHLAKDTLKRTILRAKDEGYNDIHICPETMGKINQLGTLDEVIELCLVDDSFIPTIDFGHLNSRTFGGIKTIKDYEEILDKIENKLGYDRLKVFHSHFSKIEYSNKGGEVKHLTFEDDVYGPQFEPLAELIYKKNLTPVIICESAGTQGIDAIYMKNCYERLVK